ncbi:MAG: hypothetical protein NZ840_04460 [Anaerolineales bacterium]|nr:hypothetical protein [Anaerolineales bacterium]MDW8161288.1 hypothetical protein [Anaerolineales bacterium]
MSPKLLLDLLRTVGLLFGALLLKSSFRSPKPPDKLPRLGFGAFLIGLGSLLNYWMLRPNRAYFPRGLGLRSWPVVKDGWHNSNTDMIYWRDHFYLIHAAAPFHFGSSHSHLKLWRSKDAVHWENIAQFTNAPEDIRDPKLAVIKDRLFLYVLLNREFNPEPYTTAYSLSEDGEHWTPLRPISPLGWLFWRPKTRDHETWYVPAYWWQHGQSLLLRSDDGERWEKVSVIYTGDRNDETDLEFLPDGRMIAVARLEFSGNFLQGDPRGSTLIATAQPPYTEWHIRAKSSLTRLDGPCLFAYNGRVYALGRYQPNQDRPFSYPGSIFSRKRTALFLVQEEGLVYLGDLPSAGDTSYGAVVRCGNELFLEYYTSDIRRDYPWIIGMLCSSEIRMVCISLSELEQWTDQVLQAQGKTA